MTEAANLNTDPDPRQLPFAAPMGAARKPHHLSIVIAGLLSIGILVGCGAEPKATTEDARDSTLPDDIALCPEQRPEMCTQQYDPACGYFTQSDGDSDQSANESEQEEPGRKTFGNACTACTHTTVVGYTPGPCN